ncbi:Transcriptional regulator, MarR family [Acidisarcina polymorpha]|uniref:Transcriptional regulator, MarR family n=1 Tax=Acidisarcina polymorpha TaxID=2211140 RepID=A0A2Z5FTL6_9BACT|nr:MarR family transcriptional regulator [Acidisarcina polymorpha]AXC09834.1 Transcriptional regulator, MarR family [Acidisarcina polymorpha]
MGARLQEEIKQNKPFSGLEQETILNIHRTSGLMLHLIQQILKPRGLTAPQYNVLRILRGAGEPGLRCSEIGERMVSRDPDITRLLERLEREALIERHRNDRDRRVVYSRITSAGLEVLAQLDPVVDASAKSMLGHMTEEKLRCLIELLEEIRQGIAA